MASSGLNASLTSSSSLAIAGRRIRPAVSGAVVAVRLLQKSRATTTSIRFGSSSSSANNSNNNSNTNNPDNTAAPDPAAAEPSSSSSTAKDDPSSSSSSQQQQPPQQPVKTIFNWRTMAEEEVSSYLKQNHDRLFHNNQKWADDKVSRNPEFFTQLSAGQSPEYLWIGCSDSRIPAEQIVGLEPGEAFIHRNIANLVINTDLNVMGVINYAVRHLGVKHIIICGHYGCGGVKAAMTPKDLGILNPWLRNIRDIYRLHEKELDSIGDDTERYNRLVELNVIEQCRNVIKTSDVQQSYAKNGFPIVHGWVFGFSDGLLKDLKIDFESVLEDIQKIYNLTN